jgi:hypothetical protein
VSKVEKGALVVAAPIKGKNLSPKGKFSSRKKYRSLKN